MARRIAGRIAGEMPSVSDRLTGSSLTAGTSSTEKREDFRVGKGDKLEAGLYLVATPIGNLGDMSYRAVETLKAVDLVYCEDTRNAARLLRYFGIRAKLQPYHEHNAEKQRPRIEAAIDAGQAVALISDAGMPLISDPGFKLVRALATAGKQVTSVPGATAVLTALQLSGLPTDRFLFAGFVPPKEKAKRRFFKTFSTIPVTLVFFETALRIESSLSLACEVFGDRSAAIARELTKLHEEVLRGSLLDLQTQVRERGRLRGELVLLVDRAPGAEPPDRKVIDSALLEALERNSTSQAVREVSERFELSRKDLYQRALGLRLQPPISQLPISKDMAKATPDRNTPHGNAEEKS